MNEPCSAPSPWKVWFLCVCLCVPAGGIAADRALAAKSTPPSEERVALVIGNNQYKSAPLKNPVNDARAVAQSLRSMGFQVSVKENLDQRGMMEAVRQFGSQLKAGGVGLFYFAGHGMQVKGRNFLIPVDADIQSEDEVSYLALDANQVLEKMDLARSRVNLVILDACRNNPFARSFRSTAKGLAQMEAPSGTLIAFATAPGAVAADGEGRNSTYTKHLLSVLDRPGLPVEIMFKRVREGVTRETGDRQTPWESSSLKGDFYFHPASEAEGKAQDGASGMAASHPDLAVELAFWGSIKDSTSEADFRAYLERFPKGQFASLARNRLDQAQRKSAEARPAQAKAAAQPPTSLPEPRLKAVPMPRVGDTWTYRYTDGLARRPPGSITFTLMSIDRLPHSDATETVQVTDLPAPPFPFYTANAKPAMWVREQSFPRFDFSPYLLSGPPLEKGERWEPPKPLDQFQEITDEASKVNWRFHGEVLGLETIQTPAGQWTSLKVEVVGTRDPARLKAHHATGLKLQLWYAPQAKRWVKSVSQATRKDGAPHSTDIFELVSLKVQPD